jgi:hypothetical protein
MSSQSVGTKNNDDDERSSSAQAQSSHGNRSDSATLAGRMNNLSLDQGQVDNFPGKLVVWEWLGYKPYKAALDNRQEFRADSLVSYCLRLVLSSNYLDFY